MNGVSTEHFDISSFGLTDVYAQLLPVHVQPTQEVIQHLERDYHVIRVESFNEHVSEDDDAEDWKTIENKEYKCDRQKLIDQARWLSRKSPHCKRVLDLYVDYILGNEFRPTLVPIVDDYDKLKEADEKKHKKIAKQSERAWKNTRRVNRKSWTPDEKLRRVFRDGEVFTWAIEKESEVDGAEWAPLFRFIDPEEIDDGQGDSGNKGIETDENDITEPLEYWRYDVEEGKVIDKIPADRMFHWKINVDSNAKRGRSQFESVVTVMRQLMSLIHNEVTHRTAQSAIVLVRKVAGRNKPRQLSDNAYTSTTNYPEGEVGREKYRAGSIITTNPNTEIEFAQPSSNFSDASPLVTLLISHLAAATGWTIAQITTDGSNGSFASALVNESPVLQMLQYWQGVYGEQTDDEFRYVVDKAVEAGVIEYDGDNIWDDYETEYRFPSVANYDPLKLAQTNNLSLVNRSISRAEAQRRQNLDPSRMAFEMKRESENDLADMAASGAVTPGGTNPSMGNQRLSSQQNSTTGGTNQGKQGEPVQHRDKVGVKS